MNIKKLNEKLNQLLENEDNDFLVIKYLHDVRQAAEKDPSATWVYFEENCLSMSFTSVENGDMCDVIVYASGNTKHPEDLVGQIQPYPNSAVYNPSSAVYKYVFKGLPQDVKDFLDAQDTKEYMKNKFKDTEHILSKIEGLDPTFKNKVTAIKKDNGSYSFTIDINFDDCDKQQEIISNLRFLSKISDKISKIVGDWYGEIENSIEKEAQDALAEQKALEDEEEAVYQQQKLARKNNRNKID